MDILINLKNQETTDTNKLISMNDIAGNAFVFFLAGFGSLSNTLTYCLFELALNQEVQKKAQEVIRAALEKHNGQFTYEMMMDMPYIDQLINGEKFSDSFTPFNVRHISILIFKFFNRNPAKIPVAPSSGANDKEKLPSTWNKCHH